MGCSSTFWGELGRMAFALGVGRVRMSLSWTGRSRSGSRGKRTFIPSYYAKGVKQRWG